MEMQSYQSHTVTPQTFAFKMSLLECPLCHLHLVKYQWRCTSTAMSSEKSFSIIEGKQ